VEWSDVLGRVVERRQMSLDITDAPEVAFSLDARRAMTAKNRVSIHVAIDETVSYGGSAHRKYDADASFIVSPPKDAWSDYQIIMWQRQTPAAYAALKRMGITAGMVTSDRREEPGSQVIQQVEAMLDADLGWYLENVATDFYSPYHEWFADRPKNWRFYEAKRRYWANPNDASASVRDPSLSDPAWLGRIRDRLVGNVRALRWYRPLFYNLSDEAGVADVSAYWDFDISAHSLDGMRQWLKEQYGGLDRLNEE
jgi:hypothetical protein